jgi:hypothetical protein
MNRATRPAPKPLQMTSSKLNVLANLHLPNIHLVWNHDCSDSGPHFSRCGPSEIDHHRGATPRSVAKWCAEACATNSCPSCRQSHITDRSTPLIPPLLRGEVCTSSFHETLVKRRSVCWVGRCKAGNVSPPYQGGIKGGAPLNVLLTIASTMPGCQGATVVSLLLAEALLLFGISRTCNTHRHTTPLRCVAWHPGRATLQIRDW